MRSSRRSDSTAVKVVTDASPIILLSRLELLEVLPKLYGRVTVPRAVFREVVGKGAGLPGSAELKAAPWAEVVDHDPKSLLYRSLAGELGSGETAALTLAKAQGADLVLIDERQGRMAAKRLGLAVKGTVGVLVTAKRKGEISELRPKLDELVRQGAWVAPALRRAALLAVGEEGEEEASSQARSEEGSTNEEPKNGE